MDDSVIRSMVRWPDVPDVYGWLRLDRRGRWRIRSVSAGEDAFEPIANPAFNDFIGRNYAPDDKGRWFFQNGPQRVFVGLAYAPLILRVHQATILDHCGRLAGPVQGAWLDEEGSLVLLTSRGAGLLDDRDLAEMADSLTGEELVLEGVRMPVGKLITGEVERKLGFVREPSP